MCGMSLFPPATPHPPTPTPAQSSPAQPSPAHPPAPPLETAIRALSSSSKRGYARSVLPFWSTANIFFPFLYKCENPILNPPTSVLDAKTEKVPRCPQIQLVAVLLNHQVNILKTDTLLRDFVAQARRTRFCCLQMTIICTPLLSRGRCVLP